MSTPAKTFKPEVQAQIDRRVAAGMSRHIAEDWARDDERRIRLENALQSAWLNFVEYEGREAALAAIGRAEEVRCPPAAEFLFDMSALVEGLGI